MRQREEILFKGAGVNLFEASVQKRFRFLYKTLPHASCSTGPRRDLRQLTPARQACQIKQRETAGRPRLATQQADQALMVRRRSHLIIVFTATSLLTLRHRTQTHAHTRDIRCHVNTLETVFGISEGDPTVLECTLFEVLHHRHVVSQATHTDQNNQCRRP